MDAPTYPDGIFKRPGRKPRDPADTPYREPKPTEKEVDWENDTSIDWSVSDYQIATKLDVKQSRVTIARKRYGKPRSSKLTPNPNRSK